jgi:hypothetical protein
MATATKRLRNELFQNDKDDYYSQKYETCFIRDFNISDDFGIPIKYSDILNAYKYIGSDQNKHFSKIIDLINDNVVDFCKEGINSFTNIEKSIIKYIAFILDERFRNTVSNGVRDHIEFKWFCNGNCIDFQIDYDKNITQSGWKTMYDRDWIILSRKLTLNILSKIQHRCLGMIVVDTSKDVDVQVKKPRK